MDTSLKNKLAITEVGLPTSGCEKMKDGNEIDKIGSVVLPELTDDDRDRAECKDNLAWAYSLMEWYSHGAVHKAEDLGLVFQVIKDPESDECGIRVLSAFEAETCLTFLAMLERTFVKAHYKVEIEPYLVLRPYTPAPAHSPSFMVEEQNREDEEKPREASASEPPNGGTERAIAMEVV